MKHSSANDTWQAALEELRGKVSFRNYQSWLENTVGLAQRDGSLIVGVPTSTFVTESLEKRLHPLIEKTVSEVVGRPLSVQFMLHVGDAEGALEPSLPSALNQQHSLPKFNQRYTFKSFVVGNNNELAHAAATRVASDPGTHYNPLFIYSEVGLGKTHLLHAIGWRLLESGSRVISVTSEQFANDVICALREGKGEELKNKYRNTDTLLFDDVQFIAGKEMTQEALVQIFNALYDSAKQIIITCDRPPRSISVLEDRLRSRLEWGMIVDMQQPDLETRLSILRVKAAEQKAEVPQDVLDFIASRIHGNVRELEGLLNRTLAYSRLMHEPLSINLVARLLEEIASDPSRRRLKPSLIIEAVANYYDLLRDSLLGKRRERNLTIARQMAMFLLREELQCSWTQIGNELGGRDHSTVLHGYKKIVNDINTDPSVRRDLREIREGIYSNSGK